MGPILGVASWVSVRETGHAVSNEATAQQTLAVPNGHVSKKEDGQSKQPDVAGAPVDDLYELAALRRNELRIMG
jgi:hypothetical protein